MREKLLYAHEKLNVLDKSKYTPNRVARRLSFSFHTHMSPKQYTIITTSAMRHARRIDSPT